MVASTATDMTGSIYHERQVIKYFMFSINNEQLYYNNIYTYTKLIN